MILWQEWWFWIGGALVLAIAEVLLPGFLLLGFAAGAAIVGIALILGPPFISTLPAILVVFAISSLIAWLILRMVFPKQSPKPKTFEQDYDVND